MPVLLKALLIDKNAETPPQVLLRKRTHVRMSPVSIQRSPEGASETPHEETRDSFVNVLNKYE